MKKISLTRVFALLAAVLVLVLIGLLVWVHFNFSFGPLDGPRRLD